MAIDTLVRLINRLQTTSAINYINYEISHKILKLDGEQTKTMWSSGYLTFLFLTPVLARNSMDETWNSEGLSHFHRSLKKVGLLKSARALYKGLSSELFWVQNKENITPFH